MNAMAIGTKICRICGKEYEACHTLRKNVNNEFRWQDVACCPEHGQEYLRQILESRGQKMPEEKPVKKSGGRKKKSWEKPVE